MTYASNQAAVAARPPTRSRPDRTRQRSYNGEYMDVGRQAEEIVLSFLRARESVQCVDDFRDVESYQQREIDCVIYWKKGGKNHAEIKSDYHLGKSGNVLFEILRINHTAPTPACSTLGWSIRSEATLLFYYAPQESAIYRCTMDDFRRAYQRYTEHMRDRVRTTWVNTDAVKSTLNVLIPWEWCKDIFTIFPVDV